MIVEMSNPYYNEDKLRAEKEKLEKQLRINEKNKFHSKKLNCYWLSLLIFVAFMILASIFLKKKNLNVY